VPEPSPLFWDHLSTRVGAAVREEARNRERRASWAWRWLPASAVAVAAVLVAALAVMPGHGGRGTGGAKRGQTASALTADAVLVDDDVLTVPDDASWTLMSDLSQEMTAEEAGSAIPAVPGTADRALRHLSDAERAALVDIIREEMSRATARIADPAGE
jgi:hypothetical protein